METRLSPEARRVLERLAVATIPLGKAALHVLCPRPAWLKELRDASLLAAYTNRVQVLPMVAETVRQQLTPEQRQEAEDHRRSEEHTSELQSRQYLVCRLLLEKKKKKKNNHNH